MHVHELTNSLIVLLALMVVPFVVGRYAASGWKGLGALSILPLVVGVAFGLLTIELGLGWVGLSLGVSLELIGIVGFGAGRLLRIRAERREQWTMPPGPAAQHGLSAPGSQHGMPPANSQGSATPSPRLREVSW
jgi:hypothetical protein